MEGSEFVVNKEVTIEKSTDLHQIQTDIHQEHRNSPILAYLRKALKDIEYIILSSVEKQVSKSEKQYELLAKDLDKLKFEILSFSENNEGSHSKITEQSLQYLIVLVKENLESLKTEIDTAVCNRLETIEEEHKKEMIEIKSELVKERERRKILESRMETLESIFFAGNHPAVSSINTEKTLSSQKEPNKIEKEGKSEKENVTSNEVNAPFSQYNCSVGNIDPIGGVNHYLISSSPEIKKTTRSKKKRKCIGNEIEEQPNIETNSGNKIVDSADQCCYLENARQYLMSLNITKSVDDSQHKNVNGGSSDTSAHSKKTSKPQDTTFINACEILKEPTMCDTTVEWVLRKQKETSVVVVQHSGTYYTGKPGYRVQFRAQIDRLHGDVYFSVRILKGIFDEYLPWPFFERFRISLSDKTNKGTSSIAWNIPAIDAEKYTQETRKPVGKKDNVYTEWLGPFDISKFIDKKKMIMEINLFKA